MDFSISSVLFFIVSHYAWDAEGQRYNTTVITVTNGGPWSTWGPIQFCPRPQGYVHGFSLKSSLLPMAFSTSSVLFLILSCYPWDAEGQRFNSSTIAVLNGGPWGTWGPIIYCPQPRGFANGFSLKIQLFQGPGDIYDDTAMNGLRLYCLNGAVIESASGPLGTWTKPQFCPRRGCLNSFSLRVELYRGLGDDTAGNNIKFNCGEDDVVIGRGLKWGSFGPWSPPCPGTCICGLQTKVQEPQGKGDDTGLNDARFFCCG